MKIDEKCIFNEATRRLFNRNGVEGATMRVIAEEAGVSSNTIYLYDKSKEKIV